MTKSTSHHAPVEVQDEDAIHLSRSLARLNAAEAAIKGQGHAMPTFIPADEVNSLRQTLIAIGTKPAKEPIAFVFAHMN